MRAAPFGLMCRTSHRVSGAWQLFGGATALRANCSDGFKGPSLYELFSLYSNPDKKLAPEAAGGWEVGADHTHLKAIDLATQNDLDRRPRAMTNLPQPLRVGL
jgi:outer membrane cobalamin receptor